jgi:hypothetical protein
MTNEIEMLSGPELRTFRAPGEFQGRAEATTGSEQEQRGSRRPAAQPRDAFLDQSS